MKNCFYDIIRQGVPDTFYVDIERVMLKEDLDEKDLFSRHHLSGLVGVCLAAATGRGAGV